jgi:hypothetical protein
MLNGDSLHHEVGRASGDYSAFASDDLHRNEGGCMPAGVDVAKLFLPLSTTRIISGSR